MYISLLLADFFFFAAKIEFLWGARTLFLYYINQVNEAFCGCVKYCQHKRKAFCSMGRGAICLPIVPWHDYLDGLIFIENNLWSNISGASDSPQSTYSNGATVHGTNTGMYFCHLKNSQNILKVTQVFLGFNLPK